jgi:hypothetical protein
MSTARARPRPRPWPRPWPRQRTLLLLALLVAGAARAAAKALPRRKLSPRSGPTQRTLEERGLAQATVAAADLAEGAWEFHEAAGARRFGGPVLGYVTPWCALPGGGAAWWLDYMHAICCRSSRMDGFPPPLRTAQCGRTMLLRAH